MAKLKDLDGATTWLRTSRNLAWADLMVKFAEKVTSAAARRSILDRCGPALLRSGSEDHVARQPIIDAIMLWWSRDS